MFAFPRETMHNEIIDNDYHYCELSTVDNLHILL